MADQPNVFDEGTTPPVTPPAATPPNGNPSDAYANLLSAIKNEQGAPKYSSVEKALEALKNAQEYIPSLKTDLEQKEQELAELRAAKARFENLESVVERLTARKPEGEGEPPATRGLDEQAVSELVKRTLAETEMTRKANDNLTKVQQALVDKFKDKAADVVKQRASELGVSTKDLEQLAKKSPALALQLFNTKAGDSPTVTSTDFSSNLRPPQPTPVSRPEKSLLAGASSGEIKDFFGKVRDEVYRKHGITQG
jgi:hypothetical protein